MSALVGARRRSVGEEHPSGKEKPAFWMAIEGIENWRADRLNQFKFLGIVEYRIRKAQEVRSGDFVIVYVRAPYSGFADIRRVVKPGTHRSDHTFKYDVPCNRGLITEHAAALEPKAFVSVEKIMEKLSFIRPSPRWGNSMRSSFRSIAERDAAVIVEEMAKLTPDFDWSDIRSSMGVVAGRSKTRAKQSPTRKKRIVYQKALAS